MTHQHPAHALSPPEERGGDRSRDSLAQLAVRGGAWILAGRAASQGLRLGSNLVLTRLLFPEAFGLMALVQVVLQGTRMFSDVGLRGSVVHHPRGEDRVFLNTVWTLQIAQGVAIWLVVSGLAWPVARFYEQPALALLLPVAALGALIGGFQSTAILSLQRRVRPARLEITELCAQVAGTVVMIVWALVSPSVWALVAGALVGVTARVAVSHRLIPGPADRFGLERDAAGSILRFGRWILISTSLTFLLNQGDRLVLGKLLTASELGVYSIAFLLSQTTYQMVQMLSGKLLFPLYARIQDRELSDRRRAIARSRSLVLAFALPPLWLCVLFGPEIVGVLYDVRYQEAGWMLQVLAVGTIGALIGATGERVLLARGDSFGHMILQASYAMLMVAGIALGTWWGGIQGLLIGLSGARLLSYVPFALSVRRYGLWQPGLDAAAMGLSALVIATGFSIRGAL